MHDFSKAELKQFIGETPFDSSVIITSLERHCTLCHDGKGSVYLCGGKRQMLLAKVRRVRPS
ncbi:hypothetical protein [Mitsuokella jalaludinii]|uniref:hypothetical protein n=1 Tax=Mitsuokella jalaludinii TaxID=187979 RepID=UPI003F9AE871